MNKLHDLLKSKDIYAKNRIPHHFEHEHLMECAREFVEALNTFEPIKKILLDEELILLI